MGPSLKEGEKAVLVFCRKGETVVVIVVVVVMNSFDAHWAFAWMMQEEVNHRQAGTNSHHSFLVCSNLSFSPYSSSAVIAFCQMRVIIFLPDCHRSEDEKTLRTSVYRAPVTPTR